MPNDIEHVYSFAPLDRYSLKQRLLIRAADLAFYLLIRAIGGTMRYETEGWENFENVVSGGRQPILAVWHDRIFASTYFLRGRGIVVITSQSFDGEYIARFLNRFGFGTVRGSSTRGGVRALVEMIRLMRRGLPMAFTVDGPKGPRYVAKSGAIVLAAKTGNPILPFSVECAKYWTVKSWDRLQIPKPFTKARFIVGTPLWINGSSSEDDLAAKLTELQNALDDLVAKGQEWRGGRMSATG